MSHGIYDRCVCGHPHPEHTMFGTCHGCLNCTDDVVGDADDDHPYRQCDCRKYVLGERGEPSQPSEPSGPAEDD
jgi:hypothetical protein